MHWQFGGNLQPVRMICEFDWRECPSALMNYLWSEIVTEVVECLTNEWMMWRVIALIFVCAILIHTIYAKTRLIDETTMNRENLNVVGCKVQDLELKVNILTYKMQYGTWPLPREIRGSGVDRELKNVRLTLANSNDRNEWLKHMLLSPSENTSLMPYAKIGPRSVRCLTKLINLETKYMSSKFGRDDSPLSSKEKSSRSTSELSLKYDAKWSKNRADARKESRINPRSEIIATRRADSTERMKKAADGCRSETRVMKYRDEARSWTTRNVGNEGIVDDLLSTKASRLEGKTPVERVNTTNETLNRVKEKLEDLHSVLRMYGEPTSEDRRIDTIDKQLTESILRELKDLGKLGGSESEAKTGDSLGQIFNSNSEDCDNNEEKNEEEAEETEERTMESTSEFEQCRSDDDFSSSSNVEEKLRESTNVRPEVDPEEMVIAREESSEDGKIEGSIFLEKMPDKAAEENSGFRDFGRISSNPETTRDSDNDEIGNVALLRKALEVRSALVTRIELEKVGKTGKREPRSDSSESDEVSWPKGSFSFQPKILDIISEEQSAGSSNEKASKRRDRLSNEDEKDDIESGENLEIPIKSSEYSSFREIGEVIVKDESPKDRETLESNAEKNFSEIVDRSVRNIRDYIETFSRMQSEAIAEAKIAINDESPRATGWKTENEDSGAREASSNDSITRFVNTISETTSEELPRKLSEPAIIRLVDLSFENGEDDKDFELRRRPGATSLAERAFVDEESSIDNFDSIFQSATSDNDRDREGSRANLMGFDEDESEDWADSRQNEESRSRLADSPLTGRTVVRATGSASSDFDLSIDESVESIDREENRFAEEKSAGKSLVDERKPETRVTEDNSSIYFTDDPPSFSAIEERFGASDDERSAEIVDRSVAKNGLETSDGQREIDRCRPEVRSVSENRSAEAEVDARNEFGEPGERSAIVGEPEAPRESPERRKIEPGSSSYRAISGGTIVIDSPTDKSSRVLDNSSASSREFFNLVGCSSDKSARGSRSSPLRRNISATLTGARSSPLGTNKTANRDEKSSKDRRISKESLRSVRASFSRPKASNSNPSASGLGRKSRSSLERTKASESSGLAIGDAKIGKDDERRSRSYVTPRRAEVSPRDFQNPEPKGQQRASRTRRQRDPVGAKKPAALPIADAEDSSKKSAGVGLEDGKSPRRVDGDAVDGKSVTNDEAERNYRSPMIELPIRDDESLRVDADDLRATKSTRSTCHVVKSPSKSSIPVLKSRLEAARLGGHDKRAKSPARCPLTMSTSSWKQETQSVPTLGNYVDVKAEGNVLADRPKSCDDVEKIDEIDKIDRIDEGNVVKNSDKFNDFRTVVYVNIVTEKEHKSATRVVDPKKFLEYLKDRELKIQSVKDEELRADSMDNPEIESPRLLTIVSSAVDENTSESSIARARHDNNNNNDNKSGTWSLRVEKREIEVSAKPSVIDIGTSISDLSDDNVIRGKSICGGENFQIFQVPKELTKDEYIVLLEALNQDPNLRQLKEMHNLCDKLGLGFHE